jgi:hypothetical protein
MRHTEDDRKLESDSWVQVKDEETLSKLYRSLWVDIRFYYPKLWRILGPDDRFYGYMYTAWDHAVIKVVDERTLWVEGLPTRPFHFTPGFGIREDT